VVFAAERAGSRRLHNFGGLLAVGIRERLMVAPHLLI
jgi:hypothetical protein